MCKMDMKDAYFSVPLHQSSWNYVRFSWSGNLYEFLCLCFGLGPAPRIFSKLLKRPMSVLRRINIRTVIYLDDMLIMGQTLEEIGQMHPRKAGKESVREFLQEGNGMYRNNNFI